MEKLKQITLYTDGACSGNPGVGGYGGILLYGEHKKEYSGGEIYTTNNRMEIMAVIEGLKLLKYPCLVNVYSDSAYTVNAFQNGWKKADGKPVLNSDLWDKLYMLTERHNVVFNKVQGHADDVLNNRCDQLAREAITQIKKSLPEKEENA